MHVISARNVNGALTKGLKGIQEIGVPIETRNGAALEFPTPVTTAYTRPTERVLFDEVRNANPFFHLLESMWMLAGRNDVEFVSKYSKQISSYSTDGETFNGAYGYRWRHHFGYDQIKVAIERLKKYPNDRRTVIQMWDGHSDLVTNNDELDHPCNTAIYLYIRDGKLDMTVTNRSNDMLWGTYGANAVHFSFLQEYIASMLDVGVGTYYQVSNNLHVYTDFGPYRDLTALWKEARDLYQEGEVLTRPLVNNKRAFLTEVQEFCEGKDNGFSNSFLQEVAVPMRSAYEAYKDNNLGEALSIAQVDVEASDWSIAASEWITRVYTRRKTNELKG